MTYWGNDQPGPDLERKEPAPDYTDKPTLVVGYVSQEGQVYGVEAIGFELPEGVRIIARDYTRGPIHTDDLGYEDSEVSA